MKILIVSRFTRTNIRRGGGIIRTALLTKRLLQERGFIVDTISDQIDFFDLDGYDFIWIYTADLEDVDVFLRKISKTKNREAPVFINSAWIDDRRYEQKLIKIIANYIDIFPGLGLSFWSRSGLTIFSEKYPELSGKCLYLPHAQELSELKKINSYGQREGVIVGELGKLLRPSLSRLNMISVIQKLHDHGLKDKLYVYGQYREDVDDTPLSGIVKVLPKMDFQEFQSTMQNCKVALLLTNRETFAATPVEFSSAGMPCFVTEMPQSMDDYISPFIPRIKSEDDILSVIDTYFDENMWDFYSQKSLEFSRLLSPEYIGDVFSEQIRSYCGSS